MTEPVIVSPRAASGMAALLTRALRRSRPTSLEARQLADPSRVRAILVVKLHDQLGDFLLATPALRALRERYPAARLALVTREFLAPLARRNPHLDAVWVLPRLREGRGPVRLVEALSQLAAFRPQLTVVMNSVSRSKSADALAAWSRARVVAGRSRVFAGPIPADAPRESWAAAVAGAARDAVYDLDLDVARESEHQVDRYLDLVRWTGAVPSTTQLVLELSEAERQEGRDVLARAGVTTAALAGERVRIGIHPGAANPIKCWPIESFAELGAALAKPESPPVELVVFDAPREVGRAAALRDRLTALGVTPAFVPAGGIERFAAACAALDMLVCNDSGVMHIAAALGVPTLSFHALGRSAEWGPAGPSSIALYSKAALEKIPVAHALLSAQAMLSFRTPAAGREA